MILRRCICTKALLRIRKYGHEREQESIEYYIDASIESVIAGASLHQYVYPLSISTFRLTGGRSRKRETQSLYIMHMHDRQTNESTHTHKYLSKQMKAHHPYSWLVVVAAVLVFFFFVKIIIVVDLFENCRKTQWVAHVNLIKCDLNQVQTK